MQFSAAIAFLFAASTAADFPDRPLKNDVFGQHRQLLGPRIINGVDAPEDKYPYTVSLDTGAYHFCGGSLIAPNVVLSAAHCHEPLAQSATKVIVNPYKLSEADDDETFEVESFVKHPLYQSQGFYDHDFMLIKINGASSNDYVTLNMNKDQPAVDATLSVLGWGNTALTASTGSDILQQVDVVTITNEQCEVKYTAAGEPGQIFDDSLCVAEIDQGACQGDSGGPLIIPGDDGDVQVGIVSWGIGCAMEEHPGVYARISDEFEWIQEHVCEMAGEDAPDYFNCGDLEQPPAEPVGGSCAGACGGQSLTPDAACYCDEACSDFEDCCFDAFDFCPPDISIATAPPLDSPSDDSCDGRCGGGSLDHSCFCDDVCDDLGDCCGDKVDFCPLDDDPETNSAGDSCSGQCGSISLDGSCYCDDMCGDLGDCCEDAADVCPLEPSIEPSDGNSTDPTSESTCDGQCGGAASDGTCYCDDLCVANSDCCSDVEDFCPLEPAPSPSVGNGTCTDQCGFASLDGTCWCDALCVEYGDCCSDVADSCLAGPPANPSSDDPVDPPLDDPVDPPNNTTSNDPVDPPINPPVNTTTNDQDDPPIDDSLPEGSDSCAGQCGGASLDGSCFCDADCVSFDDCCEDVDDTCPLDPPLDDPIDPPNNTTSNDPVDPPIDPRMNTTTNDQDDPPFDDSLPEGSDSCAGQCGVASLDGSCWCDADCASFNDCCEDVDATCPLEPANAPQSDTSTCEGLCGGQSSDGACFCDEACVTFGDCCIDKTEFCPADVATNQMGSCEGQCGKISLDSSCWCDSLCDDFGDCCDDQSSFCPISSRRELGAAAASHKMERGNRPRLERRAIVAPDKSRRTAARTKLPERHLAMKARRAAHASTNAERNEKRRLDVKSRRE